MSAQQSLPFDRRTLSTSKLQYLLEVINLYLEWKGEARLEISGAAQRLLFAAIRGEVPEKIQVSGNKISAIRFMSIVSGKFILVFDGFGEVDTYMTAELLSLLVSAVIGPKSAEFIELQQLEEAQRHYDDFYWRSQVPCNVRPPLVFGKIPHLSSYRKDFKKEQYQGVPDEILAVELTRVEGYRHFVVCSDRIVTIELCFLGSNDWSGYCLIAIDYVVMFQLSPKQISTMAEPEDFEDDMDDF